MRVPDDGVLSLSDVFDACVDCLDPRDDQLTALRRLLQSVSTRLREPLRLAVAGQIKRGKSTLVNALIGERVVLTGGLELTFTVNELRYAAEPVARIHYKDGRPSHSVPPADLAAWTARDDSRVDLLSQVRLVELGLPIPLLNDFHLLDTPGLGSRHGTDSANTMDLLGIDDPRERQVVADALAAVGRSAVDVHEDSSSAVERADAVLYVFSRAVNTHDQSIVTGFLDGVLSPFKTFGVVSQCDRFWAREVRKDYLEHDPMADGRALSAEFLRDPRLRPLFYTIIPVAAQLAVGSVCLTEQHFTWLADMARRDLAEVVDAIVWGLPFDESVVGLPNDHCRELVALLGQWGLALAVRYLRDGESPNQVRSRLLGHSGVPELREIVIRHFGARSAVLKLHQGINEVEREIARLRANPAHGAAEVNEVAAQVRGLRRSVPGLLELELLAPHYNGELDLGERDAAELLRLTGENGRSLAARVGVPADAAPRAIEEAARAKAIRWAVHEQDPLLDRTTVEVASGMRKLYERIRYRAGSAARLVESIDDLSMERRLG
ncbi:dynamin family protein [Actinokineospora inagensis]|uniref:dynamin family protein n=1 Tax=Actinokineospora inagensis TaxID=103730 RepID=UPI000478DC36|nr:dynamin family protein [Actinokineospora inagensis]